jgi:hypothetical protein
MKPSTRKLSEVARHVILPSGIVSTGWPAVEKRCAEFGDEFDEWQRGAGKVMLGKRANGEYAATVGGITLSIPRQVAKTFLVGRIIFALCTLFPNLTVLWSAHRTRTSSKTFGSLRGFAGKKSVAPFIAAIRTTNGEQEIHFTNGSVIMFGAREQGFGRGFDEVDIEVFDEAQILTEKALEDMVAATNQSRFPAGALLFFMGTPPRPVDPGEAFKARRRDSLALKAAVIRGEDVESDAVYIECSADGDADPDDREQWAVANPSYPHRTPLRSMLRLRKNLPSDASWRREALGIWDEDQEGSRAISAALWKDSSVDEAPDGMKSYGVAFSFDGSRIAVAGAVAHGDDDVHVELVDVASDDAGLSILANWFCEKNPDGVVRWRAAGAIVLGGSAGAGVLKQLLIDRRVNEKRIRVVSTPQYLQACAMFDDAFKDGKATHLAVEGQKALDDSVAVVDKDKRGGWMATVPESDETPVEAVSLALWGARTSKRKVRAEGETRGVIL